MAVSVTMKQDRGIVPVPFQSPDADKARAETMLALAEHLGLDLDALAFVAARFEHRLGMLDAAEPAWRAELERLVAQDITELASAYTVLRRTVERGGTA